MLLALWQLFRFLIRLLTVVSMLIAWLLISLLISWKAFGWITVTSVEYTWDYLFKAKRYGRVLEKLSMVLSLKQRFWKAVALFAYRRWAEPQTKKPVGVPGNRDPEFPCESYSPRPQQLGDWNDCEGDGHYLCQECCHLKKDKPESGTYEELVGITL